MLPFVAINDGDDDEETKAEEFEKNEKKVSEQAFVSLLSLSL